MTEFVGHDQASVHMRFDSGVAKMDAEYSTSSSGGDAQFNDQLPINEANVDERFKCPECKRVFENVHQADDCGCRFCLKCLDKMYLIYRYYSPCLLNLEQIVCLSF